jgi:hypothetical protein
MPVELCACARAMDPSRRAYRAPLLQSLNTHHNGWRQLPNPWANPGYNPNPNPSRGLQPGSVFQPWVGSAGRPGSALTPWSQPLVRSVSSEQSGSNICPCHGQPVWRVVGVCRILASEARDVLVEEEHLHCVGRPAPCTASCTESTRRTLGRRCPGCVVGDWQRTRRRGCSTALVKKRRI